MVEQTKGALQADDPLDRLASWGMQIRSWPVGVMPPQEGFSRARFDAMAKLIT